MSVTYYSLWSSTTYPWQLALPWQYINYYAYLMEITKQSYLITGYSILLGRIYEILANVSNYAITGININLLRPVRNLITSVSEYTITAYDISLYRLYCLMAQSKSIVITGIPAMFNKFLTFSVSVAEYTITGINVSFSRLRNLIVNVAEYTITGVSVGLLRPIRNMAVGVKNFLISGININFRGFGDWTWSKTTKPDTSIWTNDTKFE